MKIDGKAIAAKNLEDLKKRVSTLKGKGITPRLHIILLTDDVSSASYVRQKLLKGGQIGVEIIVEKPQNISEDLLFKKIGKLNRDNSVHGIIVQRPMPQEFDDEKIANAVVPEKDVDGFNVNSRFQTPVAKAVLEILQSLHNENFEVWLREQNIPVLGKGITAGGPIIRALIKLGIEPSIISSKTENKREILQNADIVISAVGKKDMVEKDDLKKGAIVIGVGLHTEEDGKLHGDFNEEAIGKIASFYSPTPGGVGPVNVSILLGNLVQASENLSK